MFFNPPEKNNSHFFPRPFLFYHFRSNWRRVWSRLGDFQLVPYPELSPFLNGHCVTNRQQVKLSNNIQLSKNSNTNWKFTGSLYFQQLQWVNINFSLTFEPIWPKVVRCKIPFGDLGVSTNRWPETITGWRVKDFLTRWTRSIHLLPNDCMDKIQPPREAWLK